MCSLQPSWLTFKFINLHIQCVCKSCQAGSFNSFAHTTHVRAHTHSRFHLGSLSAFRSIKICLFSDYFFSAVIYESVFAWHFESENAFNNLELGQSVHTRIRTNVCTCWCVSILSATFPSNQNKLSVVRVWVRVWKGIAYEMRTHIARPIALNV